VSLSIKKGDFVLISGEVGSGKSTLIKHMNGLLKPCSGSVEVDGIPTHKKDIRSKVGMLFQFPQKQLFGKTVDEDISFGPANFGIKGNQLKKQVHEAMDLMFLDESIASVSPFDLSGGQMRLVAMAGVLASKPDYLILDEPASGLDAKNRKILFSILKKLNSKGISIIVVSHQISDVLPLVDRLFLIDSGKIVFKGSPDEYLRSTNLYLPDIPWIMKELHDRGFDVKFDIFDIDEAFYEVSSLLNPQKVDEQ